MTYILASRVPHWVALYIFIIVTFMLVYCHFPTNPHICHFHPTLIFAILSQPYLNFHPSLFAVFNQPSYFPFFTQPIYLQFSANSYICNFSINPHICNQSWSNILYESHMLLLEPCLPAQWSLAHFPHLDGLEKFILAPILTQSYKRSWYIKVDGVILTTSPMEWWLLF